MLSHIKYILKFLNKAVDFSKAKILRAKDYIKHIFSAASHNTYIETVSNKADSIHRRIKLSYEEDIKEAYKSIIKKLLKYKRYGQVTLAVDKTDEQFYGKERSMYIFHRGKDMESKAEFHYIVISIVNANKNIPLLALPIYIGEDTVKLVQELILFAQSLLRIKLILFDRGFNNAELIHLLQELDLKFLIFAKQYKSFGYMLDSVEDSAIIEHQMVYSKNKSTIRFKTDLALIKGEEYDWCFYTNLYLDNAKYYISLYKKRWQIETNFRVEDEAKIKSKSTNYLIRYFYFMTSLLLHALWLVFPCKQFKWFLIQLYESVLLNKIDFGCYSVT